MGKRSKAKSSKNKNKTPKKNNSNSNNNNSDSNDGNNGIKLTIDELPVDFSSETPENQDENNLLESNTENAAVNVSDGETFSQLHIPKTEIDVEVELPATIEEVSQIEARVEPINSNDCEDKDNINEVKASADSNVENPFDGSNAVQPWDITADEDVMPTNQYQYQNNVDNFQSEGTDAPNEENYEQCAKVEDELIDESPKLEYEQQQQPSEENELQHEVNAPEVSFPSNEFHLNEKSVQSFENPIVEKGKEGKEVEEGVQEEGVQEEGVQEEAEAERETVQAIENSVSECTNVEQPVHEESEEADNFFQSGSKSDQDLMPWEQQNMKTNNDSLCYNSVVDQYDSHFQNQLSDASHKVSDTHSTVLPELTNPVEVEEDSILWDKSTADDSGFPWNSNNKSNNGASELFINKNPNAQFKEDENFLNSLSAVIPANENGSIANDTFDFLNNDANLSANDERNNEVFDKFNNNADSESINVKPQAESESENKFDFLEEDDDILLDDVMDDDLLDDEEPNEYSASIDASYRSIDTMLANENSNNTVLISQERRSSKYQPVQLTPRPPQQKPLSTGSTRNNNIVQLPEVPILISQPPPPLSSSSHIPRSPTQIFAKPTNNLSSVLQKEKQKSDAYDFPQEIFKNKPKPVAKENIYVKIENSSLQATQHGASVSSLPPPASSLQAGSLPPVVNPFGIKTNDSNFVSKRSQNLEYEPGSTRPSSVTSSKNNSFFAELPVPNTGRKGNLHLKNPYEAIENNSAHIPSVSPIQSIPPGTSLAVSKNVNAYMPVAISPSAEYASFKKPNSSVTSKFIPNNLPPSIKKVSNPYAPLPEGGHVRQISVTITNPDDIKPNLVPVPMKLGINSPITPTDSLHFDAQQNAAGGRYTPLKQQQQQQQQPQQPQQSKYQPTNGSQQFKNSQQPRDHHSTNLINTMTAPQFNKVGPIGQNKTFASAAHKSGNFINDVYGPPSVQINTTPIDLRRGTVLPPPSSTVSKHVTPIIPAPVVINPQNLVRRQWPLFSFSAQDKIASMIPSFDGYNHNICNIKVTDISNILLKDEHISLFPGPLTKNKTKRKDVVKWLDDKIASLSTQTRAPSLSEELTWKCLKLMMEKIDKPGDFLDMEYIKAISSILNPDLNVATAMNNSFDIIQLSKLSKIPNTNRQFNAVSLDSAGFELIHSMLEVGDKKSALEFAVSQGDWAMALLVSNLMVHFATDSIGQDLTFFVQSKGEGGFSIDQLKGKEAWLVENFGIVVPFIMMGNADYGKLLMSIGEALNKAGEKTYGTLACILSGYPLIPKFLSEMQTSIYGMIINEIYAYILLSSGNVPQNFSNGFPHLIPLEICHAGYLADIGCSTIAKKYCDNAQNLISSKQLFCEPATVIAQKNLSERLSQVGSSWISSKLSRPQLDRVWTTLDKSFNKFVAGEEVPPTEVKSDGIFSKFNTPTLISAHNSTLDLTDVRTQISRKSTGGLNLNSMSNQYGNTLNTPRVSNQPAHHQENTLLRDTSNDMAYPFPVSVTPVHQQPQGRYAPPVNHNYSTDSLYTMPQNSALQNTPYADDNVRRSSLVGQLPPGQNKGYQPSPNLPSVRLADDSNVLTPAIPGMKSVNTSPASNRVNPYSLSAPLEGGVSTSLGRMGKLSPALPTPVKLSQLPVAKPEELNNMDNLNAVTVDYNHSHVADRSDALKTETAPPPNSGTLSPKIVHKHKFEDTKPHYALEIDSKEIQDPLDETPVLKNVDTEDDNEPGNGNDDGYYGNDTPLSESTHVHQPDESMVKDAALVTNQLNHSEGEKNHAVVNASHEKSIKNDTLVSEIPVNEIAAESSGSQTPSIVANKPIVPPASIKEPENVETKEKPTIPVYKPNTSRSALHAVNRYGPPVSTPVTKKPRNPYSSMYAPSKPSTPSNYSTSSTDADEQKDETSNENGIPSNMDQIDMFSYGGYSIPSPTVPAAEVPDEESVIKSPTEESFVNKSNSVESSYINDAMDRPSTTNSIPTFRPPTQFGVPSRTTQNQQKPAEIKLTSMFSPPTPVNNDVKKVNSLTSPIYQTTEEKRFHAEDTGEYYDDVIDDSDDEEDKKKEEAARIKAAKEEADRKKKEEKEEADRKKKDEEEKKKKDSKSNGEGRWFGWLGGKGKDDKPKPIKAKLGEENSFYYDEKLKRWINKKASLEEQLESSKPPPPPMMKKPASPSHHDDNISPKGSISGAPHAMSPLTGPPITSSATSISSLGGAPPPPLGGAGSVTKKDSIDDLLSMKPPTAGGKRSTRRGPRRGYVDVMAQNGIN
ncbi:hypothetical protein C6P40_003170 [Pichia californica]|uniref:Protein transport protein sec16 n=1 Tax=Pichia californica TaxID=460514 RepID=A0A9P6WQF0_9ASCO|nr:hypothetical protein C6P40_003170 [[Candida] californica]